MKNDILFNKIAFFGGLLFVIVLGLLIQTVVLPHFFSDHCSEAGLLLRSDSDVCHQIAVGEVERIKVDGFSSWTLLPGKDKLLLSGILSLLYTLTGICSPLLFLPISALCHGLSAFLLFRILRILKLPSLAALFGVFVFICLPASFVWTLHPHKESLYILGVFLFLYAVFRAFLSDDSVRAAIRSFLAGVGSILLIWVIRPFLADVYSAGMLLAGGIIGVRLGLRRQVSSLAGMLLILGVTGFFLPQFFSGGAMGNEAEIDYEHQVPMAVSRHFHTISRVRAHFLNANQGATLVVDSHIQFLSDTDLLRYIPRAVSIGILAPVGTCSLSGGALFFAAHSLLYLGCLGVLGVWLAKRRELWLVCVPLGVVMGAELILRVMTTPNVGSLWRYLYAFKALGISAGCAVAFVWVTDWVVAYRNHRHAKIMNETSIVIVGKVLTIIGSLLGVRLMTEFLPQETYGELTLFLSVILVSQFAFGAALEQTAMRYYSIALQKQAGRLYLKKMLARWAVGSFVLGILIVLLRNLLMPSLPLAVLLSIIIFAITGMGVNLGCGIQSAARNRLLVAGLQAGFEWLRYLLAVAFILFFRGSVAVVLSGFVIAGILVLIAYAVSIAQLPIFREPAVEQEGDLFGNRYFWTMVLGGGLLWIQVFADRWCIAKFMTPADIGVYQALYQISFSPSLIGSAMLLTVIAPILFHHSKDGKSLLEMSAVIKNYNKVIVFLALFCFGVFVLAWMLRDIIPTLLLGEEYRSVSSYFPWMVLSGVLFMLSQQLMLSLCADMRIGAILTIRAVTGIVALVCYGIGAALGGIAGVVGGGICLAFISVGINLGFYVAVKRPYSSREAAGL